MAFVSIVSSSELSSDTTPPPPPLSRRGVHLSLPSFWQRDGKVPCMLPFAGAFVLWAPAEQTPTHRRSPIHPRCSRPTVDSPSQDSPKRDLRMAGTVPSSCRCRVSDPSVKVLLIISISIFVYCGFFNGWPSRAPASSYELYRPTDPDPGICPGGSVDLFGGEREPHLGNVRAAPRTPPLGEQACPPSPRAPPGNTSRWPRGSHARWAPDVVPTRWLDPASEIPQSSHATTRRLTMWEL